MNKLTEFYLNDQCRFALPESKQRLQNTCINALGKAEVVSIEDEYYLGWIEDGKTADNGGIIYKRFYHFSDGRMAIEQPGRYNYVLEPLPANPITLDNYKNYLDYLER